MWGPFMSRLLRLVGGSGGPLFGRPGGLGRRMEARYPELRNRSVLGPGSSAGRRAMLFRIALLHRHLLGSGIGVGLAGSRSRPRLGKCALRRSGTREAGESGWADGLTGGALRAGLEPPTKTSGEICCLEQCRPDAERSGPFCSGVRSGRRRGSPWGVGWGPSQGWISPPSRRAVEGVISVARGADGPRLYDFPAYIFYGRG